MKEFEETGHRAAEFDDGQVGVYVHLPFCERICPYCDFAVVAAPTLKAATEARYVAGILAELDARKSDFSGRSLASLYFGGGTPSLFSPESIRELIDAIDSSFASPDGSRPDSAHDSPIESSSRSIETTLELNPSTVEKARLPGFRSAGINRLSIGVQSFDDVQLKRLGRAHRAGVAHETLKAARAAGFDRVSVDLIFAGPGQSEADLDHDLDAILEFMPEHVSTYELTFEPETPFGRALAAGQMVACDEDRAADMIEQVQARLEAAGFVRYEISSYAKPGQGARHNARYWQRQAVLGLGMGAHSTEARSPSHPHGARRANPRSLKEWYARVATHPSEVGSLEQLSVETARGEAVFLALRQREGLSSRTFLAEFGATPRSFFEAEIEGLLSRGWLEEGQPEPGDLRLTANGRLVADTVAAEFVGGGSVVDEIRRGPEIGAHGG